LCSEVYRLYQADRVPTLDHPPKNKRKSEDFSSTKHDYSITSNKRDGAAQKNWNGIIMFE